MEKCLVTKFDGLVGNDNLPRFNCIEAWFETTESGGNHYIIPVVSTDSPGSIIKILDGPGIITSVSSPGEKISDTEAVCPANNDGQGLVNLSASGFYKVRIYQYYYMTIWNAVPTAGSFYRLDDDRLQYMKDSLIKIGFDISPTAQQTEGFKKPVGNINSINGFKKMKNVGFAGLNTINGNLKDFIDSIYAAGRTSGTMSFDMRYSGVDCSTMPEVSGMSKTNGTVMFSSSGWTQTA